MRKRGVLVFNLVFPPNSLAQDPIAMIVYPTLADRTRIAFGDVHFPPVPRRS